MPRPAACHRPLLALAIAAARLLCPAPLGAEAWRLAQPYHVHNLQANDSSEAPDARQGVLAGDALAVESARFVRQLESTVQLEPALRLVVRSRTKERILRAFLAIAVRYGKGRYVKWRDRFVVDLDEGLGGGMSMTWDVRPGRHHGWAQLEVPPDASLEVVVEKVYVPKGNTPHDDPMYQRR